MEQGHSIRPKKSCALRNSPIPTTPKPNYLCGVVYQRWQKPVISLDQYQSAASKAPTEIAYVLACARDARRAHRTDERRWIAEWQAPLVDAQRRSSRRVGQLLVGKKEYAQAVATLRQKRASCHR